DGFMNRSGRPGSKRSMHLKAACVWTCSCCVPRTSARMRKSPMLSRRRFAASSPAICPSATPSLQEGHVVKAEPGGVPDTVVNFPAHRIGPDAEQGRCQRVLTVRIVRLLAMDRKRAIALIPKDGQWFYLFPSRGQQERVAPPLTSAR